MLLILTAGFGCLATSLYSLPLEKLDLKFLILFGLTIGLGSRITLQIPRYKSHIAVSDTFIFLALLMYGGEFAVVLAAVEALFSSWRFCKKKITVFFNVGAMAFSTASVVWTLKLFGLYTENQLHGRGDDLDNFVVALSVMALTQFIVSTTFASIYGGLKSEQPIWETWKTKYIWLFITYFVGAVGAGVLLQLTNLIGFGVVIGVFPIVFFMYLTYRMYMKNVEMATQQAETAEMHAAAAQEQSLALRESEARFRSAFDYAPIGIALVSASGDWLKVNCALCDILGYEEEDFLSTNFQSMLFSEDLSNTLVKIHELLEGKNPTFQMEQRYLHKDKQTVWVLWSVSIAGEEKSTSSKFNFSNTGHHGKKISRRKTSIRSPPRCFDRFAESCLFSFAA